jgi:leader peptidase (prepilin peptidase)/N-methyltransferase
MRLSPHQILDMFIAASFGLLCLLSATLAWIDIRHGIIPDWLNLAIAGLGLSTALSIDGPSPALQAAFEGAAIGAIFWLLRRLYFTFRKVQGLGLGDVKFLAAAGIWVGVAGLPVLLLVATLTALICAGLLQLAGRPLSGQTSLSSDHSWRLACCLRSVCNINGPVAEPCSPKMADPGVGGSCSQPRIDIRWRGTETAPRTDLAEHLPKRGFDPKRPDASQ